MIAFWVKAFTTGVFFYSVASMFLSGFQSLCLDFSLLVLLVADEEFVEHFFVVCAIFALETFCMLC